MDAVELLRPTIEAVNESYQLSQKENSRNDAKQATKLKQNQIHRQPRLRLEEEFYFNQDSINTQNNYIQCKSDQR